MRKSHLRFLACPKCYGALNLKQVDEGDGDEVRNGSLQCKECSACYPILSSIPRFVSKDNYAENFGYQWNYYDKTQYDTTLNLPMSESRFYETTNWAKNLEGEIVLEAGCGAGRFTEVVLKTGAFLVSFDYSNAVEANYAMNGSSRNLLIVQGDIYCPPVKKKLFDKLYCMGVLQHTPDPEKAFYSLPVFLKSHGQIAVDVYIKEGIWKWITSYYRLRWFTRYMSVETIHAFSKKYIDIVWLPTKWLWKLGKYGRKVARYVFLTKDRFWRKGLDVTEEIQKESLVLHMIDQLCAYHDNPQTIESVQEWFKNAEIIDAKVFKGGNGIIGRGVVK